MNQYKTRGIVFHHFDYSESSVIAKIYTEQFGLESFIIKGVKKTKANVRLSLLQHLSLLDMVIYHNEKGGLQNIKEIKRSYKFSSLPFDIKKSSIALFINEILSKTVKEEAPNKELFDFIYGSIILLDKATSNFSDFHIHFLIRLTKYLGIFPNNNYSATNCFFNLKEGRFNPYFTDERYFLSDELSRQLSALLNFSEHDALLDSGIKYPKKEILIKLLDYYHYHFSELTEIKSHHILETVFE